MRASPLSLVALLAACPLASLGQIEANEFRYPDSKPLTNRFTYNVTVAGNDHPTRLWIPVPSNSPFQKVADVSVKGAPTYSINQESKFGNRMVFVELPKGTKGEISVSFTVDRWAGGATLEGPDPKGFLGADALVPIDGRYASISAGVAPRPMGKEAALKAIFNHTVETMQYDYKKESPKLGNGDVAFVCDYKKGNCSDLHSYIISMSRAQGVPAYLEYGFPITGIPVSDPIPLTGKIGGYHCWTWFYIDGKGWMPLDASDARRWTDSSKPEFKDQLFGGLVVERSAVAMAIGRDITLNPAQAGGPLNYFIYPYAESGGSAVEAKWEMSYERVYAATQEGILEQLRDLRKITIAQAAEIDRLKAQQPAPPVTASGSKDTVKVYGQVRTDAIFDSQRMNNNQFPGWVVSQTTTGGTNRSQFGLHPRLTRVGFDLVAPTGTVKGYDLKSKIELDFQNGGSESRQAVRLRHGYVDMTNGRTSLLVGQTWDLISPLFPSPNDDSMMWNAGNLGDRRPQVRFTHTGQGFDFGIALGLTGAIDGKDLDSNGIRDGEEAGSPNFQGRLGIKSGGVSFGLWGHVAKEKTQTPVAGQTSFDSNSVGVDLAWQLSKSVNIRGEYWRGRNLSDFRGGIGQGVNTGTGQEIDSRGGWVELGFEVGPKYRLAFGHTFDDPSNGDVAAGGRVYNRSWYVSNLFRVGSGFDIGVNYLLWRTDYSGGLSPGTNNRINVFLSRRF